MDVIEVSCPRVPLKFAAADAWMQYHRRWKGQS